MKICKIIIPMLCIFTIYTIFTEVELRKYLLVHCHLSLDTNNIYVDLREMVGWENDLDEPFQLGWSVETCKGY